MSTNRDIKHVRSLASKALANIGTKNGTAPLPSKSNHFGTAYEFFIASTLKSIITKRYDTAKKALIEENEFNPDTIPVGASLEVTSNEHMTIAAKKASPRKMLNKTKLLNVLNRELGAQKAAELIEAATDEAKGAVSYEVIL